jgi:hypothetical protein
VICIFNLVPGCMITMILFKDVYTSVATIHSVNTGVAGALRSIRSPGNLEPVEGLPNSG